ncbi:MAG: HAD family hydrolase [Planctomycetota bacterium]|jgi:phosphoglycolate phosphatase
MNRFDGVIFDLDGTLIDSLRDIANAANATLQELGKPTCTLESFKTHVGDGVSVLFQRALPETQSDPSLLAQCMSIYQGHYDAGWDLCTTPYPGIEKMLERVMAQGIRLAVLSNKPDHFTKRCVERFFPGVAFSHVVGHSERFPRKPDPTSAKWIASQLSSDPLRVAYVGDTNTDMLTATAAGLYPIGVSWGFRHVDEIRQAGAKIICDTAGELVTILTES